MNDFFRLGRLALVGFFLLMGMLILSDALAQTACPTSSVASDAARVCWRNATELEPGNTPIPATGALSLKSTQVSYGRCTADAGPATQTFTTVPATIGFVLYEALESGVWCFRLRHGLENGTWGDFTAYRRKTLTAPAADKPKVPKNVTVG